MTSFLQIKWIKFDDGERFPMLVKRSGGMPLFTPTVYSISMRRASGAASATMTRDLQAIMHLYTWAEIKGFDIEERFANGDFLNICEIDSLTEAAGIRYDIFCENIRDSKEPCQPDKRRFHSLEKYRKRAQKPKQFVDTVTKAVRLRYIRSYLDWLALQCLHRISRTSKNYAALNAARQQMREAIEARVPTVRNLSFFGKREGLTHETEKRLRAVIDPQSLENPWRDQPVRVRNRLFILMLLSLGLRRGELLLSRIEDVNFQENYLLVRRSPDDPEDPRTYQPNAKTRDRKLPMDDDLAQLIYDYIVNIRSKIPAARRHAFLFVAADSGVPLSMAAVTKIFATLRKRVPDLPDDLSGHVMRHTWNDRFSEMMDKQNVSENEEMKLRSYLMGWSETSGTAATYTRRHTRKKAMKVSLNLQQQMTGKDDDEEDVPY